MPTVLTAILLVAPQVWATADPLRVVDLTGGSPGLPIAEALKDLGDRAGRASL